jgi:hypothetical protein
MNQKILEALSQRKRAVLAEDCETAYIQGFRDAELTVIKAIETDNQTRETACIVPAPIESAFEADDGRNWAPCSRELAYKYPLHAQVTWGENIVWDRVDVFPEVKLGTYLPDSANRKFRILTEALEGGAK